MSLTGAFTALITPFKKNKEIDWESLESLVRWQVQSGIEGLVPMGTTGESPTITYEEHSDIIAQVTKWAREEANSLNRKIKIIAGTGSNSTQQAILTTKRAAKDGVDYGMIVNPYYNKPTQNGLLEHFTLIADKSEIPLILYNIPGRTSVRIELETILKLASHPNIVGVKEATADLALASETCFYTPEDFTVVSGDDNLTFPLLSVGAKGLISVASNVFPKTISGMLRDYIAGNHNKALEAYKKLFPFFKAMFWETNPIPVKFAVNYLNKCEDEFRLPMTPLNSSYHKDFIDILKRTIEQSKEFS